MEGQSVTLIAIVVCVILSAYFSATETAFSSLSRTRIKLMIEHGNRKAALVNKLSDNYDKLLSTILVGNNIVNIGASSLATVFFISLLGGSKGPTVSTIVLTVVILIFGEITPKSLAKEFPERFAMFSAPILRLIMLVLTPVNYIFMGWRKLVYSLVKVKDDRRMTDEELLTIVAEAAEEGGIDSAESELIRSAIEFNDLEAVDILTPRVSVVGVEQDVSAAELERIFADSGLSRLPVYEDSIDNVLGIVNLKDFYACARDESFRVSTIMTKPVYVSETMKIADLLKFLQKAKAHFAIVADEYGGMLGILTLEDILEELVGEIWDEHDEVIEEFIKLEENRYRVLCTADLEKLYEELGLDEIESDSVTISGWILEQMERIPKEGDSFTYENLTVTVTKTDLRRVLEAEIVVDPDYQKNEEEEE
ncbi:MAG: HlyC/CorC family transporter [Ruminococcaceae bacterium]|nr:HlyC/CorC family transporter [Oscillospiraceae bacterium]